jgi:hypothetical protein
MIDVNAVAVRRRAPMPKHLSLVLALAVAIAPPWLRAQPATVPPPLPPAAAPVAPGPAQPPLPASPAGTLTQSAAGAEARAGDAPASRWQADLAELDADLRLRLLSANEPRTDWLAGELESADVVSQVRHYTAARTAAPEERLYQASLATACLTRVRPPLAECEAVDRLADWARRDSDNGVPSLLLADRARQRGEADSAAAHVENAAAAPRFDDYWSQGAQHWWNYLHALPVRADPAAKAEAAANYAASRELQWANSLRALCAEQGARAERMKVACAKLGDALMTRGATFALQRAGARVAETNALDDRARKAAQARHARILEATARCTQLRPDFASDLESATPATRARGVEQFGTWASAQARDGEVGACARLATAAPR